MDNHACYVPKKCVFCFQVNNDRTKFILCLFDQYLQLWNVESGKVLGTFMNRCVPYAQEYDHHLAPVNTITFVEDNVTKVVTSSDDKKVLVWEWDIGVPIKYISDPTIQSMPAVTMHPSEKFLLC